MQQVQKGAAQIDPDDMALVVRSPRITITRCRDPDGSVYTQRKVGDLRGMDSACWCTDVGTSPESMVAVFAFDPSHLDHVPKPADEFEMNSHKKQWEELPSEVISAFGVQLSIRVCDRLGALGLMFAEKPSDPPAPLSSAHGTDLRVTHFFLEGADARGLALPPPMPRGRFANKNPPNSAMAIFCGVGDCMAACAGSLSDLPRVTMGALRAAPFAPSSNASAGADDTTPMIAIALLVEKCNSVETPEQFEHAVTRGLLHGMHAEQKPEQAVSPYAEIAAREGFRKLLETTGTAEVPVVGLAHVPEPAA